MKSSRKKNNVMPWIAFSVCFLVVIASISTFGFKEGASTEDIQSRTTTLTDVGFDTPVTFQATCTEAQYVQYLDIVSETFKENNELFDQYNQYEGVNNVYTLNMEAADHPVEVDSRIIDCIKESMEVHSINSSFDIAAGELLSLWHDARESSTPYLPSQQDIDKAMESTGIEGVIVDGNTISFADDTIQLDLGAIAKGYTAQQAKLALEAQGLDNGYINAGGNVVLIGSKADGSDWVIGIQQPDSNGSLVRFTTSSPTCLVTSGDYQRYMEVDDVRYAHIIDPKTGYPASYVRSVTVINDDSTWADAMSTALFCMSVEDGMKICQEYGLSAIWFTDEGSVDLEPDFTSQGFDIYVTDDILSQVSLSQ